MRARVHMRVHPRRALEIGRARTLALCADADSPNPPPPLLCSHLRLPCMTARVAGNLAKAGGIEEAEGWATLSEEDQETAREVLFVFKPENGGALGPLDREHRSISSRP